LGDYKHQVLEVYQKVNNEVFRYDIKERLGINQDYKQFAISDDLEKYFA